MPSSNDLPQSPLLPPPIPPQTNNQHDHKHRSRPKPGRRFAIFTGLVLQRDLHGGYQHCAIGIDLLVPDGK